jgi:hypothetical protein
MMPLPDWQIPEIEATKRRKVIETIESFRMALLIRRYAGKSNRVGSTNPTCVELRRLS